MDKDNVMNKQQVRAVESYIGKRGNQFKCKCAVKKNAYLSRLKEGGWRVRCVVHHRKTCKKAMQRLRKSA